MELATAGLGDQSLLAQPLLSVYKQLHSAAWEFCNRDSDISDERVESYNNNNNNQISIVPYASYRGADSDLGTQTIILFGADIQILRIRIYLE